MDTVQIDVVNDESSSDDMKVVDVIETVISSLDTNDTAMVSRGETNTLWKFQYGSVEVMVQLSGLTDDDMLMVWAPVMPLPAKDEPGLMRHLLEMNWTTMEARFAILDNAVVVVSARSLSELSPSEISRAITLVATLSDDNDEMLQTKFG